jgi:hypothetical protein
MLATHSQGGEKMNRDEMLRLFEAHRKAEAARDIDGILKTFVPNPFLGNKALGLRSEGRDAVRAAYEMQFFSAFPISRPTTRESRWEMRPLWCGARSGEEAAEAGSVSLQAEARSPCPLPTWSRSTTG